MFVPILGIDPGLTRCGYGVVNLDERGLVSFANAGVLSTSPQDQVSARLAEINADLLQLISETKPVAIAIERVLFKSNVTTAMSVAQVSGLVHSIAANFGIPVTEYSPTEIKKTITGDGRADKQAIQKMVVNLLSLSKMPTPADAADALAIAITHAFAQQFSAKTDSDSENATYNGSNLHNAIANAIIKQVKNPEQVKEKELKRELPLRRTRKRPGIQR